MNPAEILLNHFDRITTSTARFVRASDEGVSPTMYSAIYRGFPDVNHITAFTVGLSHYHPVDGAHKELCISMRDEDERWGLACAYIAFQLRERCPFLCGDTINFRTRITATSTMSAFLIVHPRNLAPTETVVDLGTRQVEIVQLIPLHEDERIWLNDGGDVNLFLTRCPPTIAMDPNRRSVAPQ